MDKESPADPVNLTDEEQALVGGTAILDGPKEAAAAPIASGDPNESQDGNSEPLYRIFRDGSVVELPYSELSKKQKRKIQRKEEKKQHAKELKTRLKGMKRKRPASGEKKPNSITRKQLKEKVYQFCSLSVVVDLQFEHKMSSREIISLCQQLSRLYSVNRREEVSAKVTLTSFGGHTEEHLRTFKYDKWRGIDITEKHMFEAFDKDKIVYLTSESPEKLDVLNEGDIYVIGGLVDHNRYKSFTYDYAVKEGIRHAHLPIGDYIKMATRKVLAVNHVFEILLRFALGNDWEKAFLQVIPKRKQAKAKELGPTDSKESPAAQIKAESEVSPRNRPLDDEKGDHGASDEALPES